MQRLVLLLLTTMLATAAQGQSPSYECRKAVQNHETTSSSRTGTAEERRNRINASTVNVNAVCGMQTELMQAPARQDNARPVTFTHCDPGFCYDNLGGVYHRVGPGSMTGPNGVACHWSGTSWTCN
jgi:hypothetical protein